MAPQPSSPPPIPPPVPVETHPNRAGLKPPPPQRPPPDPSRLAPEDAYHAHSPPRLRSQLDNHAANLRLVNGPVATPAAVAALRPPPAVPGTEPLKEKQRSRGSSRRRKRKGAWKKLLWVKQSCMMPRAFARSTSFKHAKLINNLRSGQLHGHGNLSRSSPAQPSSKTV